jgi:microcystin-dependent protein
MSIPVGVIIAYPVSTIPNGFLECNGQTVSKTTYSGLYSRIGDIYGTGDIDNFMVPNLNDRRPYMLKSDGSLLAQNGGLNQTSISTTQMPSHTHYVSLTAAHSHTTRTYASYVGANHQGNATVTDAGAERTTDGNCNNTAVSGATSADGNIVGTIGTTGSGIAFNILNPNICMKYCIKY